MGKAQDLLDLIGIGEKNDVRLPADDGVKRLAERFGIFRQRPTVNGYAQNFSAALDQAFDEFFIGDPIFLNRHGFSLNRT